MLLTEWEVAGVNEKYSLQGLNLSSLHFYTHLRAFRIGMPVYDSTKYGYNCSVSLESRFFVAGILPLLVARAFCISWAEFVLLMLLMNSEFILIFYSSFHHLYVCLKFCNWHFAWMGLYSDLFMLLG